LRESAISVRYVIFWPVDFYPMMRLEFVYLFAVTLATLIGFFCASFTSAAQASDNLEETVCGWFKERMAFAAWSRAAGAPNPDVWRSVPDTTPITYKTRDGRTLRGYKISARAGVSVSRSGFILVAQGNAMLADHLLHYLTAFANGGKDVFVYDYRGYGSSEGRRRLKAIVSDYRELFAALSANTDGEKLLYGISFGGIVVMNVFGGGAKFDKAVIDSAPSRLSPHGCPPEYDPVLNLPADSSKLMIISGNKDTVVTPADMSELLATAKSRGARVNISDDFAHPFMDTEAAHERRQMMVREFFFR
jgi:alpha/beta superfamily hydrolase